MESDFYFDCPLCSHTLMVDSTLVGHLVECPDCMNEISVPEIRDGLNPRFKPEEVKRRSQKHLPPIQKREEVVADLLIENLESLLRRREEQVRQMEYIRHNAELCLKQIQLLQKPTSEANLPEETISSDSGDKVLTGNTYLKLSAGFATVTLAAGILVLLLM